TEGLVPTVRYCLNYQLPPMLGALPLHEPKPREASKVPLESISMSTFRAVEPSVETQQSQQQAPRAPKHCSTFPARMMAPQPCREKVLFPVLYMPLIPNSAPTCPY